MRIRAATAVVCLASLCAACAQRPAPIPAGTDAVYYGHITRGEAFGVRVGEPATLARRVLAADAIPYVGAACNFPVSQIVRCAPPARTQAYAHEKVLRHGTIVLELRGDRVSGIGWSFFVQPLGGG